jgi:hypothetical protein
MRAAHRMEEIAFNLRHDQLPSLGSDGTMVGRTHTKQNQYPTLSEPASLAFRKGKKT